MSVALRTLSSPFSPYVNLSATKYRGIDNVFEVCRSLLEHRDRVVSKDELIEQVWPGQYISDTTLEATIREVRQALGDSGRAQRIIQTRHGRGYRFVAAVEAGPLIHPERADQEPDSRVAQVDSTLLTTAVPHVPDLRAATTQAYTDGTRQQGTGLPPSAAIRLPSYEQPPHPAREETPRGWALG